MFDPKITPENVKDNFIMTFLIVERQMNYATHEEKVRFYLFDESWDMVSTHNLSPAQRMSMIVDARLGLLPSCIHLIKYKLSGHPLQRVDRTGTAGNFAWPKVSLALLNSGYSTGRSIRGVPHELYTSGQGLTPTGTIALRIFSKALHEAGAVIVRPHSHEPVRPIENLQLSPYGSGNHKIKEARLLDLQRELGLKRGRSIWDKLKNSKPT